jgi:hypothetical protein
VPVASLERGSYRLCGDFWRGEVDTETELRDLLRVSLPSPLEPTFVPEERVMVVSGVSLAVMLCWSM